MKRESGEARPRAFPFACVILAAGAGTRYGAPKIAARLPDGERFVDAIAHLAKDAGADPIVVVTPAGHAPPQGAHAVVNARPESEQIVSLRLGLAYLASSDARGALVWPVDFPFVRLETVLAVLDAAQRTGAAIALPVCLGVRGHPVYFARELWSELATVAEGGARSVVHAHESEIAEVEVPDHGVIQNVDTRADLDAALAERSR